MSETLSSPSTPTPGAAPGPLLVACLCAQWCRTCDAYRETLLATRDALRVGHPAAAMRFLWVDIEDESDLIGDLDIEDFPTLLIARDERVLFFGPVMPHAQTLDRLVRSLLDHTPAAAAEATRPEVAALPMLLRAHAEL